MAPPGAPALRADDRGAREFPCETCGASLTFHIGVQRLKCSYCGHEKALGFQAGARIEENDLEAALQGMAARRSGTSPGDGSATCSGCGATTVFTGSLTSSTCAYCGSPLQRQGVHESKERIPVDGLLTFQVERQAAQESLRKWVRSRWLAPGAFKQRGVEGRFEGVYMPYFTFDAMTTTEYRGRRGEHYYVETGSGSDKKRERRTRWYDASGVFQRFFDDLLIPALRSLPEALLRKLEPWALERLVPFSPDALAGKAAHTYEVSLAEGFRETRARIEAALTGDVKQRIGGDEQRIDEMRTAYEALTYKHLLLPVWMLAYRHAQRTYRVVVNASTGEIHGERPWSWVKIGLLVVVLAAAVGLLAYLKQG